MIDLAPTRALAGLVLAAAPALAQQEPPEETPVPRGVVVNEQGAFQGFTLFAPIQSTDVLLIDMQGEVVHRWETSLRPTGAVYLLENGHLLRCGQEPKNPRFRGGGLGGRIQELAWDGTVVWDFAFATDERTQHHDLEPLPNGNVLFIAWEHLPRDEALGLGRDPRFTSPDGLWPDAVFEVRPEPPSGGEIVWEWHVWDHLIQDLHESLAGYGSPADEVGRIDINADHRHRPPLTAAEREKRAEIEASMRALGYAGGDEDEDEEEDSRPDGSRRDEPSPDWLHTNAVDYHARYDLIVLSTPQLGELWVIDHSTTTEEAASPFGGRWGQGGRVLWRWGNPKNYGAGERQDKQLFYQHDPQWIDGPAGELHLLVYNNGQERPQGDWSSVEELVLPFDSERGFVRAEGEPFGPREPLWIYSAREDFYSPFISGAQRLPNGNTLICEGAKGRLIEVTQEGQRVWVYENLHGGSLPPSDQSPAAPPKALFRATRIGPDHPGLAALAR